MLLAVVIVQANECSLNRNSANKVLSGQFKAVTVQDRKQPPCNLVNFILKYPKGHVEIARNPFPELILHER